MMCPTDSVSLGGSHRHRAALLAGVVAGALAVVAPVHAQGTLGTLGLGYPVNGMSTRASGTAGAFVEFDALTPTNPAALGGLTRAVLSAQAEPEFRTLSIGSVRERTTVQRVPLLMLVLPARRGFAMALSARGFLDRSFNTVSTGSSVIDGQTLPTNEALQMRGAIGDLRAAVGWQARPWLRVGMGGHIFTGENTGVRERRFADTLRFGSTLDSSSVTYFGTALSFGGEADLGRGFAASLSYRLGNSFDARIRDTTRASGSVPSRVGGALRYTGIPGSVFAVGAEQVRWSDLESVTSTRTNARDALNISAGGEFAGPDFRGFPVMLRAGYARSELPFSIGTSSVRENRFSTGLGIPIARDAASLDFSLQRANRSLQGIEATEAAWLFGIGVQIRPRN
jgi:hypothetical protein